MALALAIVLFLTIVLVVFSFGAAAYAPSSVLGSRLRALGWQRTERKERPAFKERLEQALDPLSKALPLTPSDVSRIMWMRRWCRSDKSGVVPARAGTHTRRPLIGQIWPIPSTTTNAGGYGSPLARGRQ